MDENNTPPVETGNKETANVESPRVITTEGEGVEAIRKMFDKSANIDNLPPIKKKEMILLLLGETGVGKSTFINAIVNYLSFESMDAANGRPICLIPVSFTMSDPNTKIPIRVTFGDQNQDDERVTDTTKSVTQYPKCYTFEDNNIVLNIIDTPGIADTDGVEKDNKNMQNILNFISNYREINAFCVLLKTNEARVGVVFKYCLFQLFTHLNKSAANNILFLFTNARSTHYVPGESAPSLIKFLKQINERPPNVDIPYNDKTTYCFDNESFRYLVATLPANNIQFDYKCKSDYAESWKRSVKECRRLFEYITQLPAHNVMDTLSLNNAKQIIQLLTKPLADITKNIADNVKQCETHRLEVKKFVGTMDELQRKLNIPSVEIITVPLDRPKTVCTEGECCERHTTNGVTETYYNECHSPCYLNFSDINIMGDKCLQRCKAFNKHSTIDRDPGQRKQWWLMRAISVKVDKIRDALTSGSVCLECGHSYQNHLHMLYETQTKMTKVAVNDQVIIANQLKSTQLAAEIKERQIRRLNERIAELNAENETIVQSMSMFACFLANNALTPVNDAFDEYVRLLIKNEKNENYDIDSETIARLEHVLEQYKREKAVITHALEGGANGSTITVAQINSCVDKLCSLKHKGPDIRTMLNEQRRAKLKRHQRLTYNGTDNTSFNMAKLFWETNNTLG